MDCPLIAECKYIKSLNSISESYSTTVCSTITSVVKNRLSISRYLSNNTIRFLKKYLNFFNIDL